MRIFIEPTEPLLFRTGRPFNAGENNFAETVFPPTPETLQGALRAMIAVQWGNVQTDKTRTINEIFNENAIVKLIGRRVNDHNTYGQFRITGLTLGKRDKDTHLVERLFPMPAHLIEVTVKESEMRKTVTTRLEPGEAPPGTSNIPIGKQMLLPELKGRETAGKSEPLEGWLTAQGLHHALSKAGLPDGADIVRPYKIYERESRLGIGMNNNTKTTEEGYLYQVQMIRMQPSYGFIIDIQLGEEQYGNSELPQTESHTNGLGTPADLAFLTEGWLTIGGEQGAAHFEVLKPTSVAQEHGISQSTPGHLLYFATPAYFKNGWLPVTPGILPAEPITAAINRYQPIGGWFLNPGNAGGSGKTTRRCVPAGSVYFFDKPVSVAHPLTEYGWQIGYGIAFTGEY